MTKPDSDDADQESKKPEGESAAVPLRAATASKDNAKAEPDRGVKGRRGGRSDASEQPDDESPKDEAKGLSEKADSASIADGGVDAGNEAEDQNEAAEPAKPRRRISWSRVLVYGVVPGLALLLASAAGYLKWQDASARASQHARIESLAAAKDSTIALLSYKSDSVDRDLDAAKGRLTGAFLESYSQLIKDVVIPAAKKEHISMTVSVPAAASVSATPNHAVALLFVNQSAGVDKNPSTDTASCVRVTLEKVSERWLISGFDPV